MKNSIVAPSILSANAGAFQAEILSVAKAGADWLHIDVMDGNFVPPITFGDNIVKVAKNCCDLFLDVHLMVNEPEKHFLDFFKAGAQRFTFHLEATSQPLKLLKGIRAAGITNGLAIKPATPIAAIQEFLPFCDLILIMTVEPGWGGQTFMPESLLKISALKKIIKDAHPDLLIQVDGGINQTTGKQCVAAGADSLVAGSYIFQASDRAAAINNLRFPINS